MGEVDQRLAQALQIGQCRKLRTVVSGDRLKDIIPVLHILGADCQQGIHDTVWIASRNADHPVLPGLSLDHGQQGVIVITFRSDDEIRFPVSELAAIICGCRTFLDAPAKNPFVFPVSSLLWRPAKLLWKIDVLDSQKAKIGVTIKGFSTDDLISGE